ncbi:MAG: hypothetical protein JXA97_06100 [Anaerolineales bacterium]|nr:hypothetical protein [Anaerolineales bacterium]
MSVRKSRPTQIWFFLLVAIILIMLPACSPVVENVQEESPQTDVGVTSTEQASRDLGGSDKGDSEEADPISPDDVAPEAEPAAGTTTVTVVNDLSIQICELYLSPTIEDVWGPDFLDGFLDPGESAVFELESGMLDFMALDCLGEQASIDYEEDISGGYTWNLSQSYLSRPLPEGEGDSTLLVSNDSGVEICWMYISPTSSELWGNDWLGEETLEPGGTILFYLNQDQYDIQVVDCNEDTIAIEAGFPIQGMGISYSVEAVPGPSEDGDATLVIQNPLSIDICWLYIAPSSVDVWGPNRLGADILQAGDQISFSIASGEWDVQAVDCQDTVIDARPLSIEQGGETTWALSAPAVPNSGGDSSLQVVNETGVDICWILISPSTASVWGEDWLGTAILYSGEATTFSLDAGLWDMIAYDCDQNIVAEEYQITIPAGGGTWTINQ